MTTGNGPAAPRSAFVMVITTLVGLHACMAATRVAASLAVLQQGHPAWMVGVLLSLYAVAPIGLSLWAGRLADRHGFHRPAAWAVGPVTSMASPRPAIATTRAEKKHRGPRIAVT